MPVITIHWLYLSKTIYLRKGRSAYWSLWELFAIHLSMETIYCQWDSSYLANSHATTSTPFSLNEPLRLTRGRVLLTNSRTIRKPIVVWGKKCFYSTSMNLNWFTVPSAIFKRLVSCTERASPYHKILRKNFRVVSKNYCWIAHLIYFVSQLIKFWSSGEYLILDVIPK